MSNSITGKKVAKNLILSVTAQVISILISFMLGFIVPKLIDQVQYSYWQTYLLYVGYVGILHFGILDGIVLRYSQFDYNELDKPRIRSQFQVILGLTSLITFFCCLIASFLSSTITKEIVILVAIGIVTKNIVGFNSYTLQMTNRIAKYSLLVILQRVSYAVVVAILLLCRVNNFYWYCIADLIGDEIAIVIGIIFNREVCIGKGVPIKECLKECWLNISAGSLLLVANFTANLLVGGSKMVIQWRWDELVFGQVSFSFSVSNIFLTFVTAVSVVLFPSLKRMNSNDLPNMYMRIRNVISPILFFVMIVYFPGCWILERWLPNYSDSLIYLGILLPIIIFSTKVNLLTNNYLKAYRKEKVMLVVNIVSVIIGMIMFALGAYLLNNLNFVLYSLVFVIMLNSVASEIIVTKIINRSIVLDFIIELVMTIIFILSVQFLSRWWACLVYGCALIAYFCINYKKVIFMLRDIKKVFFKNKKSIYQEDNNIKEDS